MSSSRSALTGLIGGGFLGVCLTFALGAATAPPAAVAPRYSVQVFGNLLLVTDNATNRLYGYENTSEGSILRTVIDLSKTGDRELKSKLRAAGAAEPHVRE